MPLYIDYQSDGFPPGAPVRNGHQFLTTTWDDLLWAAVTVGRPNRHDVFQHGESSIYEAIFRWSLIRMALEQSGPGGSRLRRTTAARTLDPSEKGAVSYFLGLAISKLFAASLLDTPWLLHLDVFRPQLNAVLSGRSRPDLVGEATGGGWSAFECKGRITPPDDATKTRAKRQAQRLISIDGVAPRLNIGSITYFRNEVLNFYWRDPEPEGVKNPIEELHIDQAMWGQYYAPVLQLLRSDREAFDQMKREMSFMRVSSADIEIGIHPAVLVELDEGRWEVARDTAQLIRSAPLIGRTKAPDLRYHADGIAVVAGQSWSRPFADGKGSVA